MKKKELKNLAVKIAKCERIINSSSSSEEERKRAAQEMFKLSNGVQGIEDLTLLDEMIIDILEKNS